MSHLSRHIRRQNSRNIILLLIGLIIALIFFVQVGFRLLINSTIFVNNLLPGKKSEVEKKTDDTFFGMLDVDSLPSATNEADLIVSGEAQEFDTVEYYINNSKVETAKVKNGSFESTIGKLKTGENAIKIVAKTDDGKRMRESDDQIVFMDREPPTLEITSPADNSTVSKQDLVIEGKTDKNVTVTVNNSPIVVNFEGNFKKSLRLKEGDNTLEFHAIDEAGNSTDSKITVKYQKDE